MEHLRRFSNKTKERCDVIYSNSKNYATFSKSANTQGQRAALAGPSNQGAPSCAPVDADGNARSRHRRCPILLVDRSGSGRGIPDGGFGPDRLKSGPRAERAGLPLSGEAASGSTARRAEPGRGAPSSKASSVMRSTRPMPSLSSPGMAAWFPRSASFRRDWERTDKRRPRGISRVGFLE